MIEHIKRILVVDDEPEFVKTIERHLRRQGFSLESGCNGEDAQQKIHDSVSQGLPFDLVITDLVMPTMNGIELLSWIMKNHPEISVLVITGFGEADLAVEMMRPEMDGFAQKPFKPNDMTRLIGEIDHKRKNYLYAESGDCRI